MFMLFAGSNYYPGGGWHDYRGSFVDIADAKRIAREGDYDWWHIVAKLTVVATGSKVPGLYR